MKEAFALALRDMSVAELVDLITRYNHYVQQNYLADKGILPIDVWAETIKNKPEEQYGFNKNEKQSNRT